MVQIHFSNRSEVLCQIKAIGDSEPFLAPAPISKDATVMILSEKGMTARKTDDYNQQLTYVFAGDLKKVNVMIDVPPTFEFAAKAYIDALPDDIPVILLWS